jgi:NAD dependent epimerase/dehydratase family enzyme
MAEATILESARVLPACLSVSGFDFQYPELEAGLRALLPQP